MQDQAHELRKIAWEKKRKAKYITVSSGKGGAGKTNFAVNLACALNFIGKKVLVFDADLGLANVDILLNIKSEKTIKDYLNGSTDLDSILISTNYGFDILPSASGFVELSNLSNEDFDKLMDIFIKIDEIYDYIIFDTGAGISENVLRFAPIADFLIVITQPEPTAITDAYAYMKVVEQEYKIENIYLIVNRVKDVNSGKLIYENLKKVVDKFLNLKINFTGVLREDVNLIKSVKSQKPIFIIGKNFKYSKDIIDIANSLTGLENKLSPKYSLFDFIRRFAK